MAKIARHLDRDDMVRTTMQSFTGLTVGCAQCHDHKFDPITQLDYYKLQSVFAALDRADKTYDPDPATALKRKSFTDAIVDAEREIKALRQATENRITTELAAVDNDLRETRQPAAGTIKAFGYHSKIERKQDVTKWVQVDLGKPISINRIALRPCKDDFNDIGAGFGFPVRFTIRLSDDPDFRSVKAMTTIADETKVDFSNPKLQPISYPANGQTARYVRITATKLAPRKNDFIFALAELEVLDEDDVNRAKGARVTSLDSIEAAPRWQRGNLTDGNYPGDPALLELLKEKRRQLVNGCDDGRRAGAFKKATKTNW